MKVPILPPLSFMLALIFAYQSTGDLYNIWFKTSLDKPPGTWVLGGGWNNDLWGGGLPIASWIDDITPQNPVSVVEILNVIWDLS